jgi:hypothetical protein
MEMCKVAYSDILIMPVLRFYNLIKWKARLEEEKQKLINENMKKKGRR